MTVKEVIVFGNHVLVFHTFLMRKIPFPCRNLNCSATKDNVENEYLTKRKNNVLLVNLQQTELSFVLMFNQIFKVHFINLNAVALAFNVKDVFNKTNKHSSICVSVKIITNIT